MQHFPQLHPRTPERPCWPHGVIILALSHFWLAQATASKQSTTCHHVFALQTVRLGHLRPMPSRLARLGFPRCLPAKVNAALSGDVSCTTTHETIWNLTSGRPLHDSSALRESRWALGSWSGHLPQRAFLVRGTRSESFTPQRLGRPKNHQVGTTTTIIWQFYPKLEHCCKRKPLGLPIHHPAPRTALLHLSFKRCHSTSGRNDSVAVDGRNPTEMQLVYVGIPREMPTNNGFNHGFKAVQVFVHQQPLTQSFCSPLGPAPDHPAFFGQRMKQPPGTALQPPGSNGQHALATLQAHKMWTTASTGSDRP